MQNVLSALRGFFLSARARLLRLSCLYRSLALWAQAAIAILLIALVAWAVATLSAKPPEAAGASARTVTLESLSALSGDATGGSVIGTVRARAEAEITAEASGRVERVSAALGQGVGAGAVLAELENASESAAVLQAEGAYDAAVAARAAVSPEDPAAAGRNAFRSAYASIDTALTASVDRFFGQATPAGPSVLLAKTLTDRDQISRERTRIDDEMADWQKALASADSADPATLLADATAVAGDAQALTEELARSATAPGSGATSDQLDALAAARSAMNGAVATLASATAAYRSGSTSSTASVDAAVKSARGALDLANANYEKTVIRAPIAGTVNYFPLRAGDYVSSQEHVATVADNGALEVVLYVSQEERAGLTVGAKLTVDDGHTGVVTEIAPALDPVTKQIEVRVALDPAEDGTLVDGQSVRVALPSAALASATEATSTGPLLLPLSSVKLSASARSLFTVGSDGRLVALPVEVGEVRGDRIEVTSALPAETRVVVDARGLSEGERVNVAPE